MPDGNAGRGATRQERDARRLHRSMDKFVIIGGVPLNGEVRIAGAKNAVLKQMAAAINKVKR